MIYTMEELKKAHSAGQRIKYLFFWGHTPRVEGIVDASCLSQWWQSEFTVDGINYSCAEQYMMAEKARLFGDRQACEKIMQAKHSKQMKAFGREVRHFDDAIWQKEAYGIVKRANEAKFRQNSELRQFLMNTNNRVLVEASPVDRVWGIGLDKHDPNKENPLKWRGTNWLGFALSEARDNLRKEDIQGE